jgi:hypothetical protein
MTPHRVWTLGLALANACGALACSASRTDNVADAGSSAGEPPEAGASDGGIVTVPHDASGCIGADAGALALTSDSKPITFVVAAPDPAKGDWKGDGDTVAQVFQDGSGAWKANLLSGFDMPGATPKAVLSGTPASCTTMTFSGDGWTGTLDQAHFAAQNGTQSLDLLHVARLSPTLGAAPPAGAVVLFDGTSFDAWVEKAGPQWLQAAGPSRWKLVDGAMEIVPDTDSLISKQSFGDALVHVEFRAVGTPTHSGVFLEARYQTTILQNYGLYTGNVTGNFGNASPVLNPQIRADRAPLEWQTLDIDFQAPRFDAAGTKTTKASAKVTLNGVLIFDRTPLDAPVGAAGRLPEAATGPILLEYHGMPVQYRNIWVLPSSL